MMFEEVLKTYDQLEPPGSDTWNPLLSDTELWHRVRLFLELRHALSLIRPPLDAIKVLDVGCGNGRSTRALLEFGVRPGNVMGIDLRASAMEYARALNPAISYVSVPNLESWPESGQFDLCMQCTVFSSISGQPARSALAQKMAAVVPPGGYVYWWDLVHANAFAGGDRLEPGSFFDGFNVVFDRPVSLEPTLAEAIRPEVFRRLRARSLLQRGLGFQATHRSALYQKRR